MKKYQKEYAQGFKDGGKEVLDEMEKWAKKRLGGDWKQHEIMLDLLAEIKKLREEL